MNFQNINEEWLNIWNDIKITEDAFITANSFSKKCIKEVNIIPTYCMKELGKTCTDCWRNVYHDMWRKKMIIIKRG